MESYESLLWSRAIILTRSCKSAKNIYHYWKVVALSLFKWIIYHNVDSMIGKITCCFLIIPGCVLALNKSTILAILYCCLQQLNLIKIIPIQGSILTPR